jgi:hypothetical protein
MWYARERVRNMYKVLIGEPEGQGPLGRPRHRWEDWIKMDLRKIGWGGVGWIHLAQDRDHWRAVVNSVMNLWVGFWHHGVSQSVSQLVNSIT